MVVDDHPAKFHQQITELYHAHSRTVYATLVRLLGDFELAEEAVQDAFTTALCKWPETGIPTNPRAWLISAGRFQAVNRIRRDARFLAIQSRLATSTITSDPQQDDDFPDDRLRMIFTCCHPALAPATQIALTLREICGLSTEEIAAAFLADVATIAQRIVRGKAKIRDAGIPYHVPELAELPERLEAVLSVIYLVFNEGYSATSGEHVTRPELSREAIRLGRLLVELLPNSEAIGLLALMLLQESRHACRTNAQGDLILLEDQDRRRWDQSLIREGQALVEQALSSGRVGPYALQAAISAVHAEAVTAEATDWPQIVALYDLLYQRSATPIIALNRAVAIAMRDGPIVGIELIEQIVASGELADYYLIHAARADLYRRSGNIAAAKLAYQQAMNLARQDPERRFLQRRLQEIE